MTSQMQANDHRHCYNGCTKVDVVGQGRVLLMRRWWWW